MLIFILVLKLKNIFKKKRKKLESELISADSNFLKIDKI